MSEGTTLLTEEQRIEAEEYIKKERERIKQRNINLEQERITIGRIFTRRGQAESFIKEQPLFYDKAGIWWLWNKKKTCYEVVDEVDILNLVEKNLLLDTINSKTRTEIIEALKQEGRKNLPEPIKNTWIQFKNKIVDVKTGEEKEATPKYFVTNPIPWALEKDCYEETPVIDRIFTEWVGEENKKQLYEIAAYCLLPDYPIHRIFCFIGEGLNGKSKYLELIRRFIGNNNVTTTELDTLLTSRFEVGRLHKKLVCLMGETNFNEMNKTSMLKKLSGGDLIGFEYKRKDPFEDKNYAKILISTNNLPTTTDKTIGFYRRWMIIDFPNRFSEKKDVLKEIPEEEYNALARKSLIIIKELLENRAFHNEGSIEERQKKYEDHSDPLQKFLNEYVKVEYEGFISKSEFHKRFDGWCHENKFRKYAENTLGRKMKEKGIEEGRKHADWLYDGKGGQYRVWEGITWN